MQCKWHHSHQAYCTVLYILNLLLHYHDCDPWQPGVLLRAWEEIKASLSVSQPAKHRFSLIQRAETEALNRTAVDQSQAGEGRFCPSNKVTGKTALQCSSSAPPSVGKERCAGSREWCDQECYAWCSFIASGGIVILTAPVQKTAEGNYCGAYHKRLALNEPDKLNQNYNAP